MSKNWGLTCLSPGAACGLFPSAQFSPTSSCRSCVSLLSAEHRPTNRGGTAGLASRLTGLRVPRTGWGRDRAPDFLSHMVTVGQKGNHSDGHSPDSCVPTGVAYPLTCAALSPTSEVFLSLNVQNITGSSLLLS